eukprot:760775-Rhodomonas_salina.1
MAAARTWAVDWAECREKVDVAELAGQRSLEVDRAEQRVVVDVAELAGTVDRADQQVDRAEADRERAKRVEAE